MPAPMRPHLAYTPSAALPATAASARRAAHAAHAHSAARNGTCRATGHAACHIACGRPAARPNGSCRTARSQIGAAWLHPFCAALLCALFCALLWGMPGLALAQAGVLPVPELTARVIDQTGTLSDADKAAMEAKLADYEKAKGSQIVVLMVPTTQPEDIAAYAHRVASTWKIGRRDVGDGVLLVVAKNDRRMRIEVARALEGALPDLAVARILDHTMKPQFRHNHYAQGISAALDQIMRALDGEELPLADRNATQAADDALDMGQVLTIAVFCSLLCGTFLVNRTSPIQNALITSLLTGGVVGIWSDFALSMTAFAAIVAFGIGWLIGWGNLPDDGDDPPHSSRGGRGGRSPIIIGGSSSGGWGSGSGGGFSSGGGGSFGGGGASGGW